MKATVTELSKVSLVKELLNDPERKSILKIFFELVYLLLLYRTLPSHYFSRYLFKKDKANISDYFPSQFLYAIKARFNEQGVRSILDNKLFFDFYFRKLHFNNLPPIWMYNHRNLFVIGEEHVHINNEQDFINLIARVINNNSSDKTVFIKKTYGSYGGANIYKIHVDDLENQPVKISALYNEIIKSGFLFQETIKQHPEMNRFNSSCLNTMRLDTFINSNGSIEIISGYLKSNLKNHYIDNERSGACEIPIHLETGKLKKHGHMTIKYNGLVRPTEHPTTKTVFENFTIPHFDQAKELAIKAAGSMPGLRLVGWDVAIGADGPLLIEGNSDYDMAANDLSYGGYRSNPIFLKVLEEVKSMQAKN